MPTRTEVLTDRQRAVLTFIETQIAQMSYPPTIREIGKHLGMRSTNGVNDHLKALERKGYIKREDNKSRTLRVLISVKPGLRAVRTAPEPVVTLDDEALPDNVIPLSVAQGTSGSQGASPPSDDLIDVPLLGRVAAGAPILAEQDAVDTVRISSFFLGRGANHQKIFALTVVGESMIEDGICDGDFLFVKKQPTARAGEIVVVMIEGEATCKRFFPEGDRIRLQPANSTMEPIFVHKSEFKQTDILGIVVGVYRKL